MNGHRRILQNRIQVAAVRRGRIQAQEGIRRGQGKQQEAEAHHTQHTQDSRAEPRGQPSRANGHGHCPQGQQENPQQQRAFVSAPQGRHAIEQRQRRVGILGNIEHAEIVRDKRVDQAPDGGAQHHELTRDGWSYRGNPAITPEPWARDAKERLQARQQQGQDESKVA